MPKDLIELIQSAKDVIGDDAIPTIEEHLGIKFNNQHRACCPFHQEKTPSFVWNPKTFTAKCFGCSKSYSILDYYVDIKGSYKEAVNELFRTAHIDYDLYGYRPFEGDRTDWFANYAYPSPEGEPTPQVVDYLQKRGIGLKAIEYAEIKGDKLGNIAFEYRDLDNKLLAVKYRPARKIKHGEPKMWFQKNASSVPILWNVKKLDYTRPLLITEGEIDALSAIEAGWTNVASVPNGANSMSFIEFNYDFLQNFEKIILWFDNDVHGQEGLDKIIPRLGEYRCKIVKPTPQDEQMVIDFYEQFGRKNINKTDANNILIACGPQRVMELINRAEEIPVKNLKYLMDCEVTNIKDIEKITMGVDALDNILYGNLMSTLTIYSGLAGSGKSSLCNLTSVISPVEQGEKVFIFSGELSEGQLLDWIISPLAGINHTIVWDNNGGRKSYSTTQEAEQAIKKYYHDNIILYSAEDELETSEDGLLGAMEIAFKKYGCKVFLVDNLLCVPFEGNGTDDKWTSQKKFIIKLMNFTKIHGVSVNLVVHPRKPGAGEKDLGIYSLHGASELSNLCHRLITVKRLDDDEEGYSMEVSIVKDRPSQSAGKKCKLMYDFHTRRIYSTDKEFEHKYNWEQAFTPQYSENITKRLMVNRSDVMREVKKIQELTIDSSGAF